MSKARDSVEDLKTLDANLAAKLPKSGGALTGAVTTNSTFDGVAIATRDGVLTSTTATAAAALPKAGGTMTGDTLHGDSVKAKFGTGNDLEIYHNGSDSWIANAGGNLNIQVTENAFLQILDPASNKLFRANDDGDVELYHNGSQKLATTSTGVDVTGTVTADGLTLGDNDKAKFGASDDLQIYHDGSNSIIYEGGTGDLQLRGNGGNTTIMNGGGTATLANFGNGSSVDLYHNNAKKLATTATGIDVTGTVTADGLTLGDNEKATFGAGGDLEIYHDGGTSHIRAISNTLIIESTTGDVQIRPKTGEKALECNDDGSVKVYYDGSPKLATTSTGVDVTGTITGDDGLSIYGGAGNAYLSVGSNTGSWTWKNYQSSHKLTLEDSDGTGEVLSVSTGGAFTTTPAAGGHAVFNEGSVDADFRVESNNSSHALFVDGGTDRVGILNTAPARPLEVTSNSQQIRISTASSPSNYYTEFHSAYDSANPFKISGFYNGTPVDFLNITAAGGFSSPVLQLGGGMSYLSLYTGTTEHVVIQSSSVVFNEGSNDQDFRVESNNLSHALFVQGSNGYVGIGNTPVLPLDVAWAGPFGLPATSGTAPVGFMRIGYSNRSWNGNEMLFGIINDAANGQNYGAFLQCKDPTNYAINKPFFINPQGGKFRVGTTDSYSAVSDHIIVGSSTGAGSGAVGILNTSGVASCPALVVLNRDTSTDSSNRFIQFYANATTTTTTAMGGIVGNGASNVQFASLSDVREKENITTIAGSLAKIGALNPVEFDWITSGEHCNAGFVAQEVETIFPEFVVENISNDGEEERKGVTGGMTGGIVPHLVKAIQEQQALIENLTTRLTALEG